MEVCGVMNIGQSKAIERYIATKCHLLGQSDEEEALIDCIAENIWDIKVWQKMFNFMTCDIYLVLRINGGKLE